MFTLTVSLDSLSVYIVVADVVALLSYVLYLFNKKRKIEKSIADITAFISEYFINTGAEVKVTCFKLEGNRRFVTLIESQPLKRFRYSNILESNLIAHVLDLTGNEVEKVYWRFPIQLHNYEIAVPQDAGLESDDQYFSNGVAQIKEPPDYKVTEATWDDYESPKTPSTDGNKPE